MPGLVRAATSARPAVLASFFRPGHRQGQGVRNRHSGLTKYITSIAVTLTNPSQPFPNHAGFATMTPIERVTDKLEAPALDDRSYRVIRLPNMLEALLVHDPETDKASASVNVNVGSFSDADDMPGMAHAVEHLLFMGTEKVRCHISAQTMLTVRSIPKKMPTVNTLLPIRAIPTHIQLPPKPITFSKSPLLQILKRHCMEHWTASLNSSYHPFSSPRPSIVS